MTIVTADMALQLRAYLAEIRGRKITQVELAREFGLSDDTISRYENPNYRPQDAARVPTVYLCAMLYKIDEAHQKRHTEIPLKYATRAPLPPRLRAALERAESGPEINAPPPQPEPKAPKTRNRARSARRRRPAKTSQKQAGA